MARNLRKACADFAALGREVSGWARNLREVCGVGSELRGEFADGGDMRQAFC